MYYCNILINATQLRCRTEAENISFNELAFIMSLLISMLTLSHCKKVLFPSLSSDISLNNDSNDISNDISNDMSNDINDISISMFQGGFKILK